MGFEIPDPLAFKGRQGSGHIGGRCAYSDKSLEPKYDWEKYLYGYRTWGRLAFNPDCDPEVWRRVLKADFADAADAVDKSLSNAGRILSLITTYHGPSADCTIYWPEMYTDIPIVEADKDSIYWDEDEPKVFGNASPMDPQLFSRIDEFADALLAGNSIQKYTPIEAAEKLEEMAADASKGIAEAERAITRKDNPNFRRIAIDVRIQAGIARFFAAKTRAAMLWRIYEQTGEPEALKEAVEKYRLARKAWKEMSEGDGKNYVEDVSFGETPNRRGNWSDRLAAIDGDLSKMEKRLAEAGGAPKGDPNVIRCAMQAALSHPRRQNPSCDHVPQKTFIRGKALPLEISVLQTARQVNLYYRRVNQALPWQVLAMTKDGNVYNASIPAEYTRTNFPLQYYFGFDTESGAAIYPGLDEEFMNQPYFVVRGERV